MLKGEQQAAVPEDIIMDGMHREEQRSSLRRYQQCLINYST